MSSLPTKGYRTVGIDTQIPWPAKERIIHFREHEFQLLPGSDKNAPMIRVATCDGFTQAEADKLILELLSALAWAEQAEAMTTSGNWCTAPLSIGKKAVGLIGDGHFDYLPDPPDPKAKLAMALYREGLSVNLTPYQFLGFFKVVNVLHAHPDQQMKWINDNLQYVIEGRAKSRIAEIQSTSGDVGKYLFVSGRCAISHAFAQPIVNPDDPNDLIRIDSDLPLMRELARMAIEREFKVVSEQGFHGEHLYELEGFRKQFSEALVATIKSGAALPSDDVPVPKTLALRLRDRDQIELFEKMDATVEEVRDGSVRIRLESACRRVIVFFTLNFGQERLLSEPLIDIQRHDDGTSEAAKVMLQWAQLYRGWYGGNGVIELWDISTGQPMARSQPYFAPVNSRFPHDEFEKLESEFQVRASRNMHSDMFRMHPWPRLDVIRAPQCVTRVNKRPKNATRFPAHLGTYQKTVVPSHLGRRAENRLLSR